MTESVESGQNKKSSVCEECKLNPSKYTCPGCSIRSCSLACVKAHKKRSDCNGKRKRTEFVHIAKFNDEHLLSDYKLLEEIKTGTESAGRMRTQTCKNPYLDLPLYLRSLRFAASRRRTTLSFLPVGMLKREKNKTRYNTKSKCISWTVEWRFHSTDVVLVDHGVGEDKSLCSVLENHLKPGPWIHRLRAFCDVDLASLKLFVRQKPGGAKAPFKELDIKASLRKQLAKLEILEYPVIHVYLPSQSYDFEVIRDFDHAETTPSPNDCLDNGHGTTSGIIPGEEEIEEGDIDSYEPTVLDLFKRMKYNPPRQQIPEENKGEGAATDISNPEVDPPEQGNMELELHPDLLDIYSDLFRDMKPGDYFNFDFEFPKGFDSDDDCNLPNL